MMPEDTDLERRVLAHEQILQALLAQLTRAEPAFLDKMHAQFAGHRRGAHQHDYVETADYAEAFLAEVRRLSDLPAAPAPPRAVYAKSPQAPAQVEGPRNPVMIRVTRAGGVWHVTQDRLFLGDYLGEDSAVDAANTAADLVERRGGAAEVLVVRSN